MTTTTQTSGVIHDIGYRHYDGARHGRGYIRRSLYVDSLRGLYGLGRSARSKVMPMLLFAGMCLPAGAIVALTGVLDQPELVGDYPSYLLNLQLVVLIFLAAQAPVAVSRDLRFGVMSLYLSRPLERSDYVAAKYAAMTSALFVLTATPLTLMFVGALIIGLPLGEQIPGYLSAMAGAALLSAILAGIGLVIAAFTPRRGMAVAAIIAVLLVVSAVQAVTQDLAISNQLDELGAYLGLLSPFPLVTGIQTALFGTASPLPSPPGTTGALAYCGAAALAIAVPYLILSLRYRSVSVS